VPESAPYTRVLESGVLRTSPIPNSRKFARCSQKVTKKEAYPLKFIGDSSACAFMRGREAATEDAGMAKRTPGVPKRTIEECADRPMYTSSVSRHTCYKRAHPCALLREGRTHREVGAQSLRGLLRVGGGRVAEQGGATKLRPWGKGEVADVSRRPRQGTFTLNQPNERRPFLGRPGSRAGQRDVNGTTPFTCGGGPTAVCTPT
jgi:hypothetical protein